MKRRLLKSMRALHLPQEWRLRLLFLGTGVSGVPEYEKPRSWPGRALWGASLVSVGYLLGFLLWG